MLFLPTTAARDELPEGWLSTRLPDGSAFDFKFVKVAVNLGKRPGNPANALPDLLRSWFGPEAGRPGTGGSVRFSRTSDTWWVEPTGQVVEFPTRGNLIAYPSLRAAAGVVSDAIAHIDQEEVRLPAQGGESRFAVRASGDSMDGGASPIRNGDWVVLEWARGEGLGAVQGKVALVSRGDGDVGSSHFLKRVVRDGRSAVLRSDNRSIGDLSVDDTTTVLAVHRQTIRPEELAPPVGLLLADDDVADSFSLTAVPSGSFPRVDGHLFILLDEPKTLSSPNIVSVRVPRTRPAETAYVLARVGSQWRYCGVGRQVENGWEIPEVDFATWRACGGGRSASRVLSDTQVNAARTFVDEVLHRYPGGSRVEAGRETLFIRGPAARGGIRIDGGADGFKERTVSLTDIAWVLEAARRRDTTQTSLDEEWVNRCRYLDGTPRGSTRWIDTGWAIALVVALAHPVS